MTAPVRRRLLPWLLAVVLAVAVGWVVLGDVAASPQATVRGAVGSEKVALLRDPRVLEVFRDHGIDLKVDPVGSRRLATTLPLDRYDFAFPSSAPAADRLLASRPGTVPTAPFTSPMSVVTYRPIADLLTRAGVVRGNSFDVRRYLELVAAGTRWDELPGNTAFPARKDVLVSTTEPCESNSAAMYLAITSYVAGGERVPPDPAAARAMLPELRPLFQRQGYLSSTSETLFDDYVAAGMGKTPMALVYEAQYLSRQLRDEPLPPDAVALVPNPTVYSRHTVVPLTDAGRRVADLLATDPELAELAAGYGFRPQDPARFAAVLSEAGVPPPPEPVNVVEPPQFDVQEALLTGLGCPP